MRLRGIPAGAGSSARSRVASGLATLALLAASAFAGATLPAHTPRPAIVFVLVDDLRWDDIGLAGHPFVETPNIDRIGREGVRFRNAFATTPLCSPSRASFLTGQYARRHGIVDNTARDARSHALETFPRRLQASGYRTAFVGKWHMGNDDSPRPGFTRWVAMRGQGEALDPVLNRDGRRDRVAGYVTDVLTEEALRFIRESGSEPFVLYLAHKALHPNVLQRDDGSTADVAGQPAGFIPAPRHRGRYARARIPRSSTYGRPPVGKPALLRRIDDLPPLGPETVTSDETIRQRLEMLLAVDESLGRIRSQLESLGRADDTLIVVTSDHGYFYGEHGLSEERRLAYEESIRIPLLMRYPPRLPAGRVVDSLVLGIDLAPTLLEVAGVPPDPGHQGRSLLPLLQEGAPSWRRSFLVEYWSDTVFPRIRTMGYEAVRTERYKYIRYKELPGMDELYDLEADPGETKSLFASAGAEPLQAEMTRELEARLAEAGAPAAGARP
jgi:N-acetylglucosamine-6-sulfatase